MAELGLVLVGPRATGLQVEAGDDVPVLKVRSEVILPLEEDLAAMVGYAASSTFHGADADRFELLDPANAAASTEMLWGCAQVQSAGIHQATASWDHVLVVGWADEPALLPTVRILAGQKRPITVLLGGEPSELPQGAVRRSHVVLADLLRNETINSVIHNPDPERVLDIAMDAARHPDAQRSAVRVRPVDLGPALDLPPTWCMPAAPAVIHELVHVRMGYAELLPALALDVATWRALHELAHGPPVDVGATDETGARGRLPDGDVHEAIRHALASALDEVVLRGNEPLVEQLARVLRPVTRRIEDLLDAVRDVERSRLAGVRSFAAAGIHYTVHSLSGRLDTIRDPYPVELVEQLEVLLHGEASGDGAAHVTEWRRVFAGVTSGIVPVGTPGARVARKLVEDRFAVFKAEFTSAIAERIDRLVTRARNPEAPPSTVELRALKQRAERVRDAIDEALARLDERITRGCEQAVVDDRFVRWTCPDGAALRQLLLNRIQALPEVALMDRLATEALTRRALGMADDRDFEVYLAELAREVHGLQERARATRGEPTYESVLLLLLQGRDPPVLRQAIARSASAEVELRLERPVEPALMNWLTATGMLVVVAPRLRTCAIYWQRSDHFSQPSAERDRVAITEHRIADLALPPPEGDSVTGLVALVRAVVALIVGLVVGELTVVRREGLAVYELRSRVVELPPLTLVPHGAIHALAADPERLTRIRQRIERRIVELPLRADAREATRKLVELATLGPSPTLAAQLGLYGARFEHLEQPIHALLRNECERALAVLVDCLSAHDLERVATPPQRRALLDLLQLAPAQG